MGDKKLEVGIGISAKAIHDTFLYENYNCLDLPVEGYGSISVPAGAKVTILKSDPNAGIAIVRYRYGGFEQDGFMKLESLSY